LKGSVARNAPGPGAALLDTLFAVDPFYWTSFYKRARFFQLEPRPEPPQIILDITKDCPFECSFCFASGTLGTGRRINVSDLEGLERSISGLPKVILLGGEPLVHPEFRRVISVLSTNHEEVEIFTNGRPVPTEPGSRNRWIEEMFGGHDARVTLNLAVDRFHREQYGSPGFGEKIDDFLDMAEQGEVRVRFNVTAEGLYSAGYLQARHAEKCLEELHERLAGIFSKAMEDGTAEDRFQFNPVIRMGRAVDAPGEYMKAADVLFAPEVVVTPDEDSGLSILGFLPATWMPVVPDLVRLGRLSESSMEEILLEDVIGRRFEFAAFPEARHVFMFVHSSRMGTEREREACRDRALERLERAGGPPAEALLAAVRDGDVSACCRVLRIYSAWQRLDSWPGRRREYFDLVADRLYSLCSRRGQGYELHTDHKIRRITAPILVHFVDRYLGDDPAEAAKFVGHLADVVTRPVVEGGFPAFTGYREQPGLITDAPDAPIPLAHVGLDLGIENPYYGDALVRPRVVVHAVVDGTGRLNVEFNGVGRVRLSPQKGLDEAARAHGRLFGYARHLIPRGMWPDLDREVRARLENIHRRFADQGEERLAALAAKCLEVEPVVVEDPADETPAQVFRLLVREQEAHLKQDADIPTLLEGDPLDEWSRNQADGFRSMLKEWREAFLDAQ